MDRDGCGWLPFILFSAPPSATNPFKNNWQQFIWFHDCSYCFPPRWEYKNPFPRNDSAMDAHMRLFSFHLRFVFWISAEIFFSANFIKMQHVNARNDLSKHTLCYLRTSEHAKYQILLTCPNPFILSKENMWWMCWKCVRINWYLG